MTFGPDGKLYVMTNLNCKGQLQTFPWGTAVGMQV
jgi:hypothetical protein